MDSKYPVLYISYDGLLEPLGRSQIVPYVRGLTKEGYRFIILSFEKPADLLDVKACKDLGDLLEREGIEWKRLVYHKSPHVLSTLYDILVGSCCAFRFVTRRKCLFLHVRSYVPAMIALIVHKLLGTDFVFDMRGFWVDERVEAGIWKRRGVLYKAAKYFEKKFIGKAKAIITLTETAQGEIKKKFPPYDRSMYIDHIPTCVDLGKFGLHDRAASDSAGAGSSLDMVYSGSASTWYMPHQIVEFYQKALTSFNNTHLLVCTREPKIFTQIIQDAGLDRRLVAIKSVSYDDMPSQLQFARIGLAFYKPGYSRKACCPTKIGEYLACGLAVVVTEGVGDTAGVLIGERVGVIINDFTEEEYARAIKEVSMLVSEPGFRRRCRAVAEKYFSIEHGIARYKKMYTEAFL